jgi:hypothetical protein
MPSGKNWIYFLYVNLAFILYIIGVFYYSQVAIIKADGPLYRYNLMYMHLADNIEELTFITGFMDKIHKIRTFFSSIVENIFEIFLNVVIEFHKITIGITDLIRKIIGMDGSVMPMQSTWYGQSVKSLGKCFHPNTLVKLKNGDIKAMKDISLGDVLEDGSIVESVMKIDNKREPEPLYVIKKGGMNEDDIYVTGSHLVYDKSKYKFIKIKKYFKAELTDKKVDWFSCLITNTHKIPIGNEVFWDWEDHFFK